MYTYNYPHPAVTADCLVFARTDEGMKLLLIQRKNEPCKGKWAFPGGFMDIDETTVDAARRELKEETGLVVGELHRVGIFDAVDRDPRERIITVAYYTIPLTVSAFWMPYMLHSPPTVVTILGSVSMSSDTSGSIGVSGLWCVSMVVLGLDNSLFIETSIASW